MILVEFIRFLAFMLLALLVVRLAQTRWPGPESSIGRALAFLL